MTERKKTTPRARRGVKRRSKKKGLSGAAALARLRVRLFTFGRAIRRFFSDYVKYRAPQFWRRHWGVAVPSGTRYEDFCETTRPTPLPKDVLGREGERYAFNELVRRTGWRPIACNAENYFCEIDLIFLNEPKRELVFVEVKTRSRDDARYPPAIYAVDAKRRKKLALGARKFAYERGYVEMRLRFDVVVAIMPPDAPARFFHYQNAFLYSSALSGYDKTDYGKRRGEKRLRADLKGRKIGD